jgi:hypothetical protein
MVDARRLSLETIVANDGDWLYLFVAPEYYFAASDSAHAIPQDENEHLVGSLRALSMRHPTLVRAATGTRSPDSAAANTATSSRRTSPAK